jgi:hypothetical protein
MITVWPAMFVAANRAKTKTETGVLPIRRCTALIIAASALLSIPVNACRINFESTGNCPRMNHLRQRINSSLWKYMAHFQVGCWGNWRNIAISLIDPGSGGRWAFNHAGDRDRLFPALRLRRAPVPRKFILYERVFLLRTRPSTSDASGFRSADPGRGG